MNKKEELLVILMEECGELIQECSKLIRSGNSTSKAFTDEVGDVLTLIDLVYREGMFSYDEVDDRKLEKIQKLKVWSNVL